MKMSKNSLIRKISLRENLETKLFKFTSMTSIPIFQQALWDKEISWSRNNWLKLIMRKREYGY